MNKYKHKTLWRIAKTDNRPASKWYTIKYRLSDLSSESWTPAELIENSSDREEVKEKKKFLKNGMYIWNEDILEWNTDYIRVYYRSNNERLKHHDKYRAYKKIMARCEEINEAREPDFSNIEQKKYFVCYDYEYSCPHIISSYDMKANDFIIKEYIPYDNIPLEIKTAVFTFFTS